MVRIIGHRGAAGLSPENSLSGFRHALTLGLDGIEFDVHRSADGALLVAHDPLIDRVTTGTGAIGALTAEEIRASRLKGAPQESVPTLEAVLDLVGHQGLELQIELKTDQLGRPYPGLGQALLAMLDARGLIREATLTSFVPSALQALRALHPTIGLLASINRASAQQHGGLEAAARACLAAGADVLAIEQGLLAPALPAMVDAFGARRLGVWAPDDPASLARWMTSGLRQITTDRPDLALAARRSRP